MIVDAIVLAGGRSSRLGSFPKAELYFAGETLLSRTLSAVRIARRTVVVGPMPTEALPEGVLCTREDPPLGGPAAGIAAGANCLVSQPGEPSEVILVVACDMPNIEGVIPPLLEAFERQPDSDGIVPTDADGRRQPLAAAYRTASLVAAVRGHEMAGSLSGVAVSVLIQDLALASLAVADQSTADVDNWEDADRLGVTSAPVYPSATTEGVP